MYLVRVGVGVRVRVRCRVRVRVRIRVRVRVGVRRVSGGWRAGAVAAVACSHCSLSRLNPNPIARLTLTLVWSCLLALLLELLRATTYYLQLLGVGVGAGVEC